jgi:hypothetical protein
LPEYEQLVRRSVAAVEHAQSLTLDARRIHALAQVLRDAAAGNALLLRCAWCGRFNIGDEWLHLHAVGRGQQSIATSLRDKATHGICPDCLEREQDAADRARVERGSRSDR